MDAPTPQSHKQTADSHREDGAAVRGGPAGKYPARSLWLWVALAFAFGAILWAAMFTASRHIDTREVPLAPQGAKP